MKQQARSVACRVNYAPAATDIQYIGGIEKIANTAEAPARQYPLGL
jgi:hypothetical protein